MSGNFPNLPQPLEIHSDKDTVFLRQLTPADAQAFFDIIDFDRAHFQHGEEITPEKYKTVQDVLDSFEKERPRPYYRFGIWEDGVMVGTRNLEITDDGESAEVGAMVGKQFAGNHYSSRSALLLQDFAFRNLNLTRIFAMVNPNNLASIRSVMRAGFVQVENGGGHNLKFEITREQWEGAK
ncbi:GNAT family N-acetyltransferase [Candidatus Saccharibacteria bacterium]|nr:GNAT family N-acetyltransferase [Candidatus Saccharibacteria bacterium]